MSEQLELFRFGSSRRLPYYSIFFAIMPEQRTIQRVLQLTTLIPRYFPVRGSFRLSHKLHTTVLGFGFDAHIPMDALGAVVQTMQRIARAVAPGIHPFEIAFDRL